MERSLRVALALPGVIDIAERTSASVTWSAKWFQLFQPIGGVAASLG